MEPTHRFLRACRQLPVDRTPVWLMRQAGRHLPAYRTLRARHGFLELCRRPELAAALAVQPVDELDVDAAIVFTDLLVPLAAMGMEIEFDDNGPSHLVPARSLADVSRLVVPDPRREMSYVLDAVAATRELLAGRVPLIGFAGAPFSLAAYAIEGGGSQRFVALKRFLFSEPQLARALLDKLVATVVAFLEAQVAAGAEAVQLFDTWAGILSPRDFEELALRPARQVIAGLRDSATFRARPTPIIYFINGAAPYLEALRRLEADVIGLDWRVDIGGARARLTTSVQGNLDPAALFRAPEEIEQRTREILLAAGSRPGHIFNLGQGVIPQTDLGALHVLIDAVHRHGASLPA